MNKELTPEQIPTYYKIFHYITIALILVYALIVFIFGYFFHIDIFGYSDRNYNRFFISFLAFMVLFAIGLYIYGTITKNPYFHYKWRYPTILNLPLLWKEGGKVEKVILLSALPTAAVSLFFILNDNETIGALIVAAYLWNHRLWFNKYAKKDFETTFGEKAGAKLFENNEKQLYNFYSVKQTLILLGIGFVFMIAVIIGIGLYLSFGPK